MTTRGIPEVPMGIDHQTRRFLTDLRQTVVDLRDAQSPPNAPSNLQVTANAFGIVVQWTRATNSDFSEVIWSNSPDVSQGFVVPVADAAQWVDHFGQVGVQRWYWVRAAKNTGARSTPTGPLAATSLASNAGVNPPQPPPKSQDPHGGGRYQLE